MITGVLLLFSEPLKFVGIGMLVLLVIIELMELFRSQEIVMSYNNQVMKTTLAQVKRDLSPTAREPLPRR